MPLWTKARTQTAQFWTGLGSPAAEQRLELNPLYPAGGTNLYPMYNRDSHPWPGNPGSDAALQLGEVGPIPAWPYKPGTYGWCTTDAEPPKGTTSGIRFDHAVSNAIDRFAAIAPLQSMSVNAGADQLTSSWAQAAAKAQAIALPTGTGHDVCCQSNLNDSGTVITGFDAYQFSQNMGHLSAQIFHSLCLDGQARVDAFRYRYGLVGGSFSDPADATGNGVENIQGMSYINSSGDFSAVRDMWAIAPASTGADGYVTRTVGGKALRVPMPLPVAGMPLSTVDLIVRGLRAGKSGKSDIPTYITDALQLGKTPADIPADSVPDLLQQPIDADNLVRWLAFTPERQRGPAAAGGPAPNTFVQRPILVGPTTHHCFGDEGGLCTTYEDALHEDFTEGLRACRWGHSNAKGFSAYGLGVSDGCINTGATGAQATGVRVPSVDLGTDSVQRYWETEPTVKPVLILRTVLGNAKPFDKATLAKVVAAVGTDPELDTLAPKAYGCTPDPKTNLYSCPGNGTGDWVTSSNGNITTSRIYGSCYIEVTAKFADASQVVNAIWTFTASDGQPDAPWMPTKLDGLFKRSLYDNAEIDIELPSNAEQALQQRTKDNEPGQIPLNYRGTYSPSGYTAVGAAAGPTDRPFASGELGAAGAATAPSAYGTDHGAAAAATTDRYRDPAAYRRGHPTGADAGRMAGAYSSSDADVRVRGAGGATYQAHYSPVPYCGKGNDPCPTLGPVTMGSDTVTGLLPLGLDDTLNATPKAPVAPAAGAPAPGPTELPWCCPNGTNTVNYNSYSASNNNGSGSVEYVNIPLVAPGDKQIFGDGKYHTYGIEWHAGGDGKPAVIHWFQDGVYQASSNVFVPYRMGRIVIGSITTGGHPWTWSGIASNLNNSNPESAISDVHIVPFEEEADYYTPQSIDQALQWRIRSPYRIAISIADAFEDKSAQAVPVPAWAPYWGLTDLEIDSSAPTPPSGTALQGFKITTYPSDAVDPTRPTANYTPSSKAAWEARLAALQATTAERQGVFVVPGYLTAAQQPAFARPAVTASGRPRIPYRDPQSTSPLDDPFRNPDGLRARCKLTADGTDKLTTYATVGPEAMAAPRLKFDEYKQLDNPFSNDDLQDATSVPAPAVGVACSTDADCPLSSGQTLCDQPANYQPGAGGYATPPKQCKLRVCGDAGTDLADQCKALDPTQCKPVKPGQCCGARCQCKTGFGSGVCYGPSCKPPSDPKNICLPGGEVPYGYPTNDYNECATYIQDKLGGEGWRPYISVYQDKATWVVPTNSDGDCPGPAQGAEATTASCPTLGGLFTDGGGVPQNGICKFNPAPACACYSPPAKTCPTDGTTQCSATSPSDPTGCKCTCSGPDHNTGLSACVVGDGGPCTASVQCSSGKCTIADGQTVGTCDQAGGSSVCDCFRGFEPDQCPADCATNTGGAAGCKCRCDKDNKSPPNYSCALLEGAPCKKDQCSSVDNLECAGMDPKTGIGVCKVKTAPTGGCTCGYETPVAGACPTGGCVATGTQPDSCKCVCVPDKYNTKHACLLDVGSPCAPSDKYACQSTFCGPDNTCQPKPS